MIKFNHLIKEEHPGIMCSLINMQLIASPKSALVKIKLMDEIPIKFTKWNIPQDN